MKAGGPRGRRNPPGEVPALAQAGGTGVFQEQPIDPASRLPADRVELRRSKAQSGEDRLIHFEFAATGRRVWLAHLLRFLGLMLGVQILEKNSNRFATLERQRQSLALKTRGVLASLAA